MSEALKDRYASKAQMEKYFQATGIDQQEYETIKKDAEKVKARIDQRLESRRLEKATRR